MIDREKVIEILNNAKTIIEKWVPMFEQYNTPAGIDDAITLLKEQEPMEPNVKHFEFHYASYDKYENRAYCPKCGIQFIQQVNYCPKCGKAVKWE